MVNTDKVYLMTKAAIFEEKEQNGAIKIVTYRRQDYILYHMLLILLSASLGYFILVGTVMFMVVMAYDSIVLNVSQMIIILLAVVVGYILVLVAYYIISHKYYGDKHVKARQDIRQYLNIIRALRALEEEERAEA